MPEKDIQDILAPEDYKQGTLSKDRKWDIIMVIKQRRWRWFGHVIRKDRDSIT